mgnify:CR=1 FL=1
MYDYIPSIVSYHKTTPQVDYGKGAKSKSSNTKWRTYQCFKTLLDKEEDDYQLRAYNYIEGFNPYKVTKDFFKEMLITKFSEAKTIFLNFQASKHNFLII